jgi:hypothetical protein
MQFSHHRHDTRHARLVPAWQRSGVSTLRLPVSGEPAHLLNLPLQFDLHLGMDHAAAAAVAQRLQLRDGDDAVVVVHPCFLASPSELSASPNELLASPIELLASPNELFASPSELLASPSELLASPNELFASPSELSACHPASS